jgi:hypothetical protein
MTPKQAAEAIAAIDRSIAAQGSPAAYMARWLPERRAALLLAALEIDDQTPKQRIGAEVSEWLLSGVRDRLNDLAEAMLDIADGKERKRGVDQDRNLARAVAIFEFLLRERDPVDGIEVLAAPVVLARDLLAKRRLTAAQRARAIEAAEAVLTVVDELE